MLVVLTEDIVDVRYMFVDKFKKYGPFAMKRNSRLSAALIAGGNVFYHLSKGYLPVLESQVHREVNLLHSSSSESPYDPVPAPYDRPSGYH
jgi:hypothetical protein